MTANIDISLIKNAQSGDASAFERLVMVVYDIIYRFALKWCGSVPDAEDITQQAVIKLAKVIGQFRFESKFTSWLYRLVVTTAQDWQKSQRRHGERSCEFRETMNEAEIVSFAENLTGSTQNNAQMNSMDSNEASRYLMQILDYVDQLGEGLRETLLLVFAQGLSHKECSEVLNVKESTISWRIHHVRKHLRLFEQDGDQGQHIVGRAKQ